MMSAKQTAEAKKMARHRFQENVIEAVRAYDFLWDKDHMDFKNKCKKSDAWESIAKELKAVAKDVEKEWANLRNQYTKELRDRAVEEFSGAASSTRTKFVFFEALSFLQKHIRKRNSVTNLQDSSEGCSQTVKVDKEEDDSTILLSIDQSVLETLVKESGSNEISLQDLVKAQKVFDSINEAHQSLEADGEEADKESNALFPDIPTPSPLRSSPRKRGTPIKIVTSHQAESPCGKRARRDLNIQLTSPLKASSSSKSPRVTPQKSPMKAYPPQKGQASLVRKEEVAGSHYLSPELPVLTSPKKPGLTAKAKRDALIDENLALLSATIAKSTAGTSSNGEGTSVEEALGHDIAKKLLSVSDKKVRRVWRKKFEELRDEMEDELDV